MSHDLYTYAQTDKVFFKLTLLGVAVTGVVLQDADVKLLKDGAAAADIGLECTECVGGLGWYEWQPSLAAQTSSEVLIINIKDAIGSAFDENAVLLTTGGNIAARFNG